jgi:hypothetical protein
VSIKLLLLYALVDAELPALYSRLRLLSIAIAQITQRACTMLDDRRSGNYSSLVAGRGGFRAWFDLKM